MRVIFLPKEQIYDCEIINTESTASTSLNAKVNESFFNTLNIFPTKEEKIIDATYQEYSYSDHFYALEGEASKISVIIPPEKISKRTNRRIQSIIADEISDAKNALQARKALTAECMEIIKIMVIAVETHRKEFTQEQIKAIDGCFFCEEEGELNWSNLKGIEFFDQFKIYIHKYVNIRMKLIRLYINFHMKNNIFLFYNVLIAVMNLNVPSHPKSQLSILHVKLLNSLKQDNAIVTNRLEDILLETEVAAIDQAIDYEKSALTPLKEAIQELKRYRNVLISKAKQTSQTTTEYKNLPSDLNGIKFSLLFQTMENINSHTRSEGWRKLEYAAEHSDWEALNEGLKLTEDCNKEMADCITQYSKLKNNYACNSQSRIYSICQQPSTAGSSKASEANPDEKSPTFLDKNPVKPSTIPLPISLEEMIERSKNPEGLTPRYKVAPRVQIMLANEVALENISPLFPKKNISTEELPTYIRNHHIPMLLPLLRVPEFVDQFVETTYSELGTHLSVYAIAYFKNKAEEVKITATIDKNNVCYHLYADPLRPDEKTTTLENIRNITKDYTSLTEDDNNFEPVSTATINVLYNTVLRIKSNHPLAFESILLTPIKDTLANDLGGGGGAK